MKETKTSKKISIALKVDLPADAAMKWMQAAQATGQSLNEFVGAVLMHHTGDPFGLWKAAAVAFEGIAVPETTDAPTEIGDAPRYALVTAAAVGAHRLSITGDQAAAREGIRVFAEHIAPCWDEETHQKMLAHTFEVAAAVWETARKKSVGEHKPQLRSAPQQHNEEAPPVESESGSLSRRPTRGQGTGSRRAGGRGKASRQSRSK